LVLKDSVLNPSVLILLPVTVIGWRRVEGRTWKNTPLVDTEGQATLSQLYVGINGTRVGRTMGVHRISLYVRLLAAAAIRPKHQFPPNKSITSWRGQKSLVSVVSCRFPNSITTACCQLVTDLLATRRAILTCPNTSPCR